ncbi:MAG: hypothetical protein AABY18_04510 [Candidatus Thermoplasmatota archaeon]
MRRLTNPQIGFVLVAFAALAAGLNAYGYWRTGKLDAMLLIPTVGILALLAVVPFLVGWRSEEPRSGFLSCASCHTLWSPRDDHTSFCPGCGKMPKSAEAALQKHPYASPLTGRAR